MLVSASRSSEVFTKEAVFSTIGRMGRGFLHGVTKGTSGAARGALGVGASAVGRTARAVWKPALAVGLGTAFAYPMVSSAVRQSQAGLTPGNLQRSRMRGVSAAPEGQVFMTPYGPQMMRY